RARHQLVAVAGDDKMPREIVGGQDGYQQEAEEYGPRITTRQLHQPCDCRCGRKLAALGGLWWSDNIARLSVNAVVHCRGRQPDAGRCANCRGAGIVLRVRTRTLSSAVARPQTLSANKRDLRASATCEAGCLR